MKKPTDVGMNRTGASMSPIDTPETIEGAEEGEPSSSGGIAAIASVRLDEARRGETIGSMPPPATIKGAVKTAAQAVKGHAPTVLLDKLGERLAFERTGVRLYQALIDKLPAFTDGARGPAVDELLVLRDQELAHVDVVRRALETLGADPTAVTPSADLMGVASMGILQVLTDPRTQVAECLQALLAAELVDNAGWELLIDLARGLGQEAMMAELQDAFAEEQQHLLRVRAWLKSIVLSEAGVAAAVQPPSPPPAA